MSLRKLRYNGVTNTTFHYIFGVKPIPTLNHGLFDHRAAMARLSDNQRSAYLDADNININNKGCLTQILSNCHTGTCHSPNDMSYLSTHFKNLRTKGTTNANFD